MKNKIFKLTIIVGFCFLFPTAFTLFISGRQKPGTQVTNESGQTIIIEQNNRTIKIDVEDFIPCVLASQLPIDTPMEALKAQAVVMRTYILWHMEDNPSINVKKLDISYIYYDDLKTIAGDDYTEYYKKLTTAAAETSGQVIKHYEELIIPYFHAISTGKTRNGNEALKNEDYPYLISKECSYDTESPDFLTITYVDKNDFVNTLKEHASELEISSENPLENVQVLTRCSAGYISSIQIGNKTFTGDEIQRFFKLKSPYFEFENYEDQIRIICKGNGHGLGLSLFGASKMAENGSSYTDIITYFYTDVIVE